MDLMSMFKTKEATATPANNPAPNPNQTQQPQPTTGSAQIDQSKQGPDGGKTVKETSPLEPYTDLWKDEPQNKDGGNSNTPTPTPTPAQTNTDPDFSAFAKKVDFSRVLSQNPELVAKALGGDTNAFGQVLNAVTQAVFATALKSTHTMMAKREKTIRDSIIGELPQHFKSLSVQNSGYKNPAFKHPAMKPLVDAAKQQFLQKFPEATTAEIDDHVENYMKATFEAAGFKAPAGGKTSEDEAIDVTTNVGKMQAQAAGVFDWNEAYGFK